jgi:hypothetical protein
MGDKPPATPSEQDPKVIGSTPPGPAPEGHVWGGTSWVPWSDEDSRRTSTARQAAAAEVRREQRPSAPPRPVIARTNGNGPAARPRERRARRTTSASSTAGSGDGDLDPPLPLGPSGAERLFFALVEFGLAPDGYEQAAGLALALDEDARREREAVA